MSVSFIQFYRSLLAILGKILQHSPKTMVYALILNLLFSALYFLDF